jgi:acetyl esterase/lipase
MGKKLILTTTAISVLFISGCAAKEEPQLPTYAELEEAIAQKSTDLLDFANADILESKTRALDFRWKIISCTEDDGGNVPEIQGTLVVTVSAGMNEQDYKFIDKNRDEKSILEFYCEKNVPYKASILCDNGAENGACITCGNQVCETGEDELTCAQDCNIEMCTFFSEDFNGDEIKVSYAPPWKVSEGALDAPGYEVDGQENDWGQMGYSIWDNYSAKFRFNLKNKEGFGFHINTSDDSGFLNSYEVDIRVNERSNQAVVSLVKNVSGEPTLLGSYNAGFNTSSWQEIRLTKYRGNVNVDLNNNSIINYSDVEMLGTGDLRIETYGNGYALIDDIAVQDRCENAVCGDGTCNETDENFDTCPADCIYIPETCGNNLCENPDETEVNCREDCVQPYLDFIDNNQEHAIPLSESQIIALLDSAEANLDNGIALDTPDDMREMVIEKLNIGFLLPANQPKVEILSREDMDTYFEYSLMIIDDNIGSFTAKLLEPKDPGPLPAIIGIHGHFDNAEIFRDNYFGADLANEGYMVLMPNLRLMECQVESEVASELVQNGFSLLGLRTYEIQIMIEYLKSLDNVDPDYIGLMGHSGGAASASIASWASPDVKALAYDFFMITRGCNVDVYNETDPELAFYTPQLDWPEYETLHYQPFQKFEYGYPDPEIRPGDRDEVITFFDNNLNRYLDLRRTTFDAIDRLMDLIP